jgi:starch synthase
MHAYLPSADALIARKYSVGTIDLKVQNKTMLQQELGWPSESKRPLVCLPSGMTEKLGGALLTEILPGILSLQVELLVLGKGSAEYGAMFTKLTKNENHRLSIITEDETSMHKMYAAADMAFFLADAEGTEELERCLQYGVVPIAPISSELEDYNPVQESGNAFVFERPTKWHAFASFIRALETHKFPFDWRTIQRHCMETMLKKGKGGLLREND